MKKNPQLIGYRGMLTVYVWVRSTLLLQVVIATLTQAETSTLNYKVFTLMCTANRPTPHLILTVFSLF